MTKRSQFSERFGRQAMIALVFTDIIDSTVMARALGNEAWAELVEKHFARARYHMAYYGGYQVKLIGDCSMVAFPTADKALLFALAFLEDTGDPSIFIRAGIHVGTVTELRDDIIGIMVHYTQRVIGAMKGCGVALSDRAKSEIEDQLGPNIKGLGDFKPLPHHGLKGFPNDEVLWEIVTPAIKAQRLRRGRHGSPRVAASERVAKQNGTARGC